MKSTSLWTMGLALALSASSCSLNPGIAPAELQAAQDSVALLKEQVAQLTQEIELLKFPADQRLNEINKLAAQEQFNEAREKIAELKSYFPKSVESEKCDLILEKISAREAAIKAEQDRIKALGFKALKPALSAEILPNKVTFSNLANKKEFSHDYYYNGYTTEWYYNTADRGNIYALADMSVTSDSKNPDIPTLAIYSIQGENLILQGVYRVAFARWDSFGSYLGNETDLHNSFSKVSTVKFKLGVEVSEQVVKAPYAVVLKKENSQSRHEEKFQNPPIWYSGTTGYAESLTIDDFHSGAYQLLKLANL